MKRQQKPNWRHHHPHLHRFTKWTGRILLVLTVLALLVGLGGTIYVRSLISTVPDVTEEALRSDPSSNMYAANGELIWSSAKNRRIYVEREDIPERYVDMLLATEQKTFYEDAGFSPTGLANAFLSVIQSALGQGEIRGGSSIEQQLIKLTVFSTSSEHRTVDRKIQEFYLANQLYENYSKDEILEFYVNKLPLSENSFGVQTLAKTYYNKPMSELSDAKLALLAGTGQAPSAYNVYDNPNDAKTRRDDILWIARQDGILTEDEYQTALAEPIDDGLMPRYWQTEKTNETVIQYDAYIQSTLKQVADMGYNLDETPLQIHTALDMDLNNHIKDLFDNHPEYFQDDLHQAAATVMENSTGHVLAQVGGRFVNEVSSYNRAAQTVRSTGSSTKPFIYAAGMEKYGWNTAQPFDGSNYQYAGTNLWAYNYGMQQVGQTNLQTALRQSYNTTVLRAFDQVGNEDMRKSLNKIGFNVDDTLTSGNALGLDASTAQVANAFSTLSTGGVHKDAQFVTKLVFPDKSEKVIEQTGERALQSSTAWMLLHTLQGTKYLQPDSTNTSYIEGLPQAMKTGTVGYPDDAPNPPSTAMDLWTAGTTPSVSLAIWHGYDKPMDNGWLSEDYMAKRKHNLYRDIMRVAAEGYENKAWTQPETVTRTSGSGLGAHFRPNQVITSHFDAKPTAEALPEGTAPYFGEGEEQPSVARGDSEYEQAPKDYEFDAWGDDVDKRNAEIDKEIDELEKQKQQIIDDWEQERTQLESDVTVQQEELNAAQEAFDKEVQEIEERLQEARS